MQEIQILFIDQLHNYFFSPGIKKWIWHLNALKNDLYILTWGRQNKVDLV